MSMPVFSRTALAVETWPTSQPLRVNGTHGAGAILPFSLIISGVRSVCPAGGNGGPAGAERGAVQYADATPVRLEPVGGKYPKIFQTRRPIPARSTPGSAAGVPRALCAIPAPWGSP